MIYSLKLAAVFPVMLPMQIYPIHQMEMIGKGRKFGEIPGFCGENSSCVMKK